MASSSSTSASSAASSTSYLPPSLSLIANFQSSVTVKLENSNYFAWKTQVENALKATDLYGYVDGSIVCPASHVIDSSGVKTLNPEFSQWTTIDRMLLSCLIATLTRPILPHIIGSDHTFQLLNKLEEKFSVLSKSHVHDLRRRLFSLNKTGSVDSYIDSIKEIVQKLAASGSYIDDEELIFHTLNGLKKGYKSFKRTIRSRTEDLSFGTFSSMLLAEELHVTQDQAESSTILVASHQASSSLSSSTTGVNPVSGSEVTPTAPSSIPPPLPPFQFPFPAPPSQNYLPSFPTSSYNGPRFQRNNNRFRGNQFSIPFKSGFQGPSLWQSPVSSGFQGSTGWPSPFGSGNFGWNSQAVPSFQSAQSFGGISNTSCQICGKNNHQASTCCHRTNLGYRPFTPFGRPQFGAPPDSQHGFPSQAFSAVSDPMGYYTSVPSPESSEYAFHMAGHNGSTSTFQPPGSLSAIGAPSSGIGTSVPPWYFDSGATSHVTPASSNISEPHGVPNTASVTVGNGQAVPVAHSGRRACPGIEYSIQMLNFVLATLLHGFEILTPDNVLVDMTESAGLTNKKATPLDVLVAPRLAPTLYE